MKLNLRGYQSTLRDLGNRERYRNGSIDAGFVMNMAHHATLFVTADVPMNQGCKAGDGQDCHDQQEPVPLPTSVNCAHFGHAKGIIRRGPPPLQ